MTANAIIFFRKAIAYLEHYLVSVLLSTCSHLIYCRVLNCEHLKSDMIDIFGPTKNKFIINAIFGLSVALAP